MIELPKTKAEALAAGLKHYLTGKPCPKGHVVPRLVSTRQCTACCRENVIARRKANPQESLDSARRWRRSNPDKINAQKVRYYKKYKAALKDRRAEYLANYFSSDERKEMQRAYYASNSDIIKKNVSAYHRAYPEKHAKHAATRRVRIENAVEDVPDGWQTHQRNLQNGKCVYCFADLKQSGEHVDHIMPLAKGGMHVIRNLQILCPPCNRRKGAKDPIDFAREMGRLL